MIEILLKMILLDVMWVMGWKVATAENMVLEKVGEWGEQQVEKGYKIFDGLIVCPWCLPNLHGVLFVVPLALMLEILPHNWYWWQYAALYPFFIGGACFTSGMLWDWHLLIERKKDYYEAAAAFHEEEVEQIEEKKEPQKQEQPQKHDKHHIRKSKH